MHLDSSSLEEGLSSLYSFVESHMDPPPEKLSSIDLMRLVPSSIQESQSSTQHQKSLITPPPELRRRQDVNCQQAEQSASQAIRQASQQASQSIQQASQSASQASQQAAQSASQAIQQFSNQASQSIAAASRSVSSAVSSAQSAIASAQSSADAAIQRANGSMMSAQISASAAQADASKAVLQAGAAVAAATGSAAAAGSSFLAAAAKATQSAQASVSAIGAAASSQVEQASAQASASQTAAVTATQAALAIVGSIIASTLITILIYFLVIRHKKIAKRKSRGEKRSGEGFFSDPKFPISAQAGTTIAPSQATKSRMNTARDDPMSGSQVSFSLFPRTTSGDKAEELRKSVVKTTSVPWNPSKPPKAPTLGAWLKLQENVSPFGPIKLPDEKSPSPLGGQLKSPLRSNIPAGSPRRSSSAIPIATRSPKLPTFMDTKSTINSVPKSPVMPTISPITPEPRKKSEFFPPKATVEQSAYRESKASVWTDDVPDSSPSPPLQSPPPHLRGKPKGEPSTATKGYVMQIPKPQNPIRNTAEWFAARQDQRSSQEPRNAPQSLRNNRPSFGLPRNPRLGLPARPGPTRQVQSMEGEIGNVQGLSRFLERNERGSLISRMGSERSQISTPGVGKAM